MTVTCAAIESVRVLPDARIEMVLREGAAGADAELLYIDDIARFLQCSRRTVYALSTRKRNPLPVERGRGRPFALKDRVLDWIRGGGITARTGAAMIQFRKAKLFGN